MPQASKFAGYGPGQFETTVIFHCLRCTREYHAESSSGRVTVSMGTQWARLAGWHMTKDGWLCPECWKKRRAARPATALEQPRCVV